MIEETRILEQNKEIPASRWDDLHDDSSRYDYVAGAPPDQTLVYYWYSWFVIAFCIGTLNLILFLSIVTNKKVRRKPFNLYLVYLLVPDIVFSLFCSITCLLNALSGKYWSHAMCNFQQFYCVFGIGANAWLNALVGHQLYRILQDSHAMRRYRLPTRRTITIQAVAIYSWCILLGTWGAYESPHFPFHSGQVSGLACLPVEGRDTRSIIFFWACFFPLFVGIPFALVFGMIWKIYRRKLLPPSGQRRLLSLYFGRLIIVFLVMWIPSLLLIFVLTPWVPPWVKFVGGTWSHLQGGVSAILILRKPDIAKAFERFLRCRCHETDTSSTSNIHDGRRTSATADTVKSLPTCFLYNYSSGERQSQPSPFTSMRMQVKEGVVCIGDIENTRNTREEDIVEEDDVGTLNVSLRDATSSSEKASPNVEASQNVDEGIAEA